MRYILIFWGLPMGFFWGWYFLSYNDINFGMLFFSRPMHDFAFRFYGDMLGVEASTILPLIVRACVLDTVLIFSIYGLRKRREIVAWWYERHSSAFTASGTTLETGRAPPVK